MESLSKTLILTGLVTTGCELNDNFKYDTLHDGQCQEGEEVFYKSELSDRSLDLIVKTSSRENASGQEICSITGETREGTRRVSIDYDKGKSSYRVFRGYGDNKVDMDAIQAKLIDDMQNDNSWGKEEMAIEFESPDHFVDRSVVFSRGIKGEPNSLTAKEILYCNIPVESAGGRKDIYHLQIHNTVSTKPMKVVKGGGRAESQVNLSTTVGTSEEGRNFSNYPYTVTTHNGKADLELTYRYPNSEEGTYKVLPKGAKGGPVTIIDPANLGGDQILAWLNNVVSPVQVTATCDAWAAVYKDKMIEQGSWTLEEAEHFNVKSGLDKK